MAAGPDSKSNSHALNYVGMMEKYAKDILETCRAQWQQHF